MDANDGSYEEEENAIAGNLVNAEVGGTKEVDLEISDQEAPDLEEAKNNIRAQSELKQ